MLLRFGVIAMSFSVMLALVVAVMVTLQDKPEEVVAAESAASNSQSKTDEAVPNPRNKMLDLSSQESGPVSEKGADSGPESALNSESESASGQGDAPGSGSRDGDGAQSQSEHGDDSLPLEGTDWPVPSRSEIARASKPRHYGWVPGAGMTLTVKSIGLHNVPVIDSDSQQALDNGVIHVPGTSMPWTRSPHRNVYLAGHRLGWPGTGSRLIFYNLDKLKSGDEIILRDRQDRRYRYRVSNIFVVGPDESWVTGQIRDRDMVTLQTCVGLNFSKRLIVRADRI